MVLVFVARAAVGAWAVVKDFKKRVPAESSAFYSISCAFKKAQAIVFSPFGSSLFVLETLASSAEG